MFLIWAADDAGAQEEIALIDSDDNGNEGNGDGDDTVRYITEEEYDT